MWHWQEKQQNNSYLCIDTNLGPLGEPQRAHNCNGFSIMANVSKSYTVRLSQSSPVTTQSTFNEIVQYATIIKTLTDTETHHFCRQGRSVTSLHWGCFILVSTFMREAGSCIRRNELFCNLRLKMKVTSGYKDWIGKWHLYIEGERAVD